MQKITVYVDLVYKVLTALALLVGGGWGFWKFVLTRPYVWNLLINVSPEIIPYGKNRRLLLIKITLKNIGKVKIVPGTKGCCVSVSKLRRNFPSGSVIDRNVGRLLIKDVDVLRHYRRNGQYTHYVIEPGCEYHELEAVVAPKGATLLVEARFWWKDDDDSIAEHCIVDIP